jgi:hypothetical protein
MRPFGASVDGIPPWTRSASALLSGSSVVYRMRTSRRPQPLPNVGEISGRRNDASEPRRQDPATIHLRGCGRVGLRGGGVSSGALLCLLLRLGVLCLRCTCTCVAFIFFNLSQSLDPSSMEQHTFRRRGLGLIPIVLRASRSGMPRYPAGDKY